MLLSMVRQLSDNDERCACENEGVSNDFETESPVITMWLSCGLCVLPTTLVFLYEFVRYVRNK